MIVLIVFCFEVMDYYFIATNEYFDLYYSYVYLTILFILMVAVIFQFYYWMADDSKDSREIVPWSFLLAAIANFLLVIWILVYILALYKREKVYDSYFEMGF